MFSDELTKTAEIFIERGKALLQKGARIKLARAQSIQRAELRKQEELRRQQEETQHYHCYELACIPLTVKEEKIDDEMSIIPQDPYDPYLYFDTKETEHFYVKKKPSVVHQLKTVSLIFHYPKHKSGKRNQNWSCRINLL